MHDIVFTAEALALRDQAREIAEKYVRPREEIFNPAYEAPADQVTLGRKLVAEYSVHPRTSCSTCHR